VLTIDVLVLFRKRERKKKLHFQPINILSISMHMISKIIFKAENIRSFFLFIFQFLLEEAVIN